MAMAAAAVIDCCIFMDEVEGARALPAGKVACSRATNARVLSCGHVFHHPCIKEWITKGNIEESVVNCPMCRKKITFKRQPFYMSLLLETRMNNAEKHWDEMSWSDSDSESTGTGTVTKDGVEAIDDDADDDDDTIDSEYDYYDDDNDVADDDVDDDDDDDETIDSDDEYEYEYYDDYLIDDDADEDKKSTWHNTLDAQIEFFRTVYHNYYNLSRMLIVYLTTLENR
jgi:hypothetical protein